MIRSVSIVPPLLSSSEFFHKPKLLRFLVWKSYVHLNPFWIVPWVVVAGIYIKELDEQVNAVEYLEKLYP